MISTYMFKYLIHNNSSQHIGKYFQLKIRKKIEICGEFRGSNKAFTTRRNIYSKFSKKVSVSNVNNAGNES